jgi:hypothetical protein
MNGPVTLFLCSKSLAAVDQAVVAAAVKGLLGQHLRALGPNALERERIKAERE